jgi:phenylpropionate dioxygenase-like ring-hydroxylating dioxygenase large terminal subunit
MLSKENNERITRVGPGTPMGQALRRYWIPALLTEELPEADGPPVRVRLLGEDYVAFRDTEGQVGLVWNHCPHRGASLFFGRNEENGLRCVYHGWKFNRHGACVDMPNEPEESSFKDRVKVAAFPVVEQAGMIWTFLGPEGEAPPFPQMEWMNIPSFVSKSYQKSNWLQAMEGGLDTSHSSFLHRQTDSIGKSFDPKNLRARAGNPKLEVVRTEYGFRYAGVRHLKDENQNYVRAYHYVMPFHQMRSHQGWSEGRPTVQGHAWVPIDDETCWVYNWMYLRSQEPLTHEEIETEERAFGRHPDDLIPGTYISKQNAENNYLIDRAAQKSGLTYTGIHGINTQDMAVQESMGPIYDRTQEHLGTADLAIIQARRLLLEACTDVEQGRYPLGSQLAEVPVRAAEMLIPADQPWYESMKDELAARW